MVNRSCGDDVMGSVEVFLDRRTAMLRRTMPFILALCFCPAIGLGQDAKKGEPVKPNLTKARSELVKPGVMTLPDVIAIFGPQFEVNADVMPMPTAPEMFAVWREGKDRWLAISFVPADDGVLRVNSACYLWWRNLVE